MQIFIQEEQTGLLISRLLLNMRVHSLISVFPEFFIPILCEYTIQEVSHGISKTSCLPCIRTQVSDAQLYYYSSPSLHSCERVIWCKDLMSQQHVYLRNSLPGLPAVCALYGTNTISIMDLFTLMTLTGKHFRI